ncbi:carbohydrate-binding module family 13 protein [Agrocybe pediades]|nr:carbohydrate-binding module family 13 protein [Agrocybe pediades]
MALNIASGNSYVIVNTQSQTVMDLSGNDSVSVIGYPRHGGPNQQWELIFAQNGWHIKSVSSGKYLRHEGDDQNGRRLIATHDPFLWYIWPDTQNVTAGRISVASSSQIYDVDLTDFGNATPGTPVQIWGRTSHNNQVWQFDRV